MNYRENLGSSKGRKSKCKKRTTSVRQDQKYIYQFDKEMERYLKGEN